MLESAIKGLAPMFDPEKNLFCYRLRRMPHGLVREGVSPRYTLITLMGLSRAEAVGLDPGFDIHAILRGLSQNRGWMDNAGDLGLYLWLCSLHAPDALPQVVSNIDLEAALDAYPDTRQRRTMELAWFLAGLAHLRLSRQPGLPDCTALAYRTYQLLRDNQGQHGIFGHLASRRSYAGFFRGRIGSFADQVYPIYALSKFAQAYQTTEAVQEAGACADAICRTQGPLGQWWWHYDSATGRVIGKHPVYSVHQDGMAPMALFALSAASRRDFRQPIFHGLDWIAGRNELHQDMRDREHHLIWRSLRQSKARTYANELRHFFGARGTENGLHVNYECRPYHLGWLLYAFASPRGLKLNS
jgi:hypothetical protein